MLFRTLGGAKIINRLLRCSEICHISSPPKTIYLTFDDGPESGITEFVLEELDMYGFKGTFFCRGDNAELNPELLKNLRERGHSIGNHTYNHIHAYEVSTEEYLEDVNKANTILHASLFRPPHGSLTFRTFLKLYKKYRIVFWSLNSGDSDLDRFVFDHAISQLEAKTKSGDIVLFHCCNRHEKETRKLLPVYLKWLDEHGYQCVAIND